MFHTLPTSSLANTALRFNTSGRSVLLSTDDRTMLELKNALPKEGALLVSEGNDRFQDVLSGRPELSILEPTSRRFVET